MHKHNATDLSKESLLLLRAYALVEALRKDMTPTSQHCYRYLHNLLRIATTTGYIDLTYLETVVEGYSKDFEDAAE